MGICQSYRNRRKDLSAPESVATLDSMEEYLRGGENWAQGVYRQGDARCLVGAAEYARVSSVDDARHWLRQAIAERTGGELATIEAYNDGAQSFGEIADIVARARQLASENLPVPVKPRGVVEIIPPARLASPHLEPWPAPAQHEIPPEPDDWGDFEPVRHDPVTVPDRGQPLRRRLADWMFD